MTTLQSRRTQALVTRATTRPACVAYVDVFRGLLIAHMALDHASLMFNAGRAAEELAGEPAPVFNGLGQFLTRFAGVPVAPGFFFMAGFTVALTSAARLDRRVSGGDVTSKLVTRGLVLIAADARPKTVVCFTAASCPPRPGRRRSRSSASCSTLPRSRACGSRAVRWRRVPPMTSETSS